MSNSQSVVSSSKRSRRDRTLDALGFVNPGPKNFVNTREKRQKTSPEKTSFGKPMFDHKGIRLVDQSDRCDCNHLSCPGCFMNCSSCQSRKCGLECRNSRTFSYEYRIFGTDKEIV